VLLYSETPTVHMHTLKLAVIDISELKGRHFGIDEFRQVIHSRLYKLDPFRYELVDIPFKFHHPMWRENCEVDLDYHVRPCQVDSPGGRRQLDEAVGRIASTPLDRSKPLWEMYFIEGLANGRIAVLGKIHHALADGVASANLLARGMDPHTGPVADRDSYATDPAPGRSELIRSAFADHMRQIGRLPGVMRYTAQGVSRVRKSSKKLSPELTRPFTPPPSFMNHRVDAQRKFATATLALADVKETGRHLGVTINDMVLAISAGALRQLSLNYDGHADHPLWHPFQ
jgi:diacylglycerol O-acyltransferase